VYPHASHPPTCPLTRCPQEVFRADPLRRSTWKRDDADASGVVVAWLWALCLQHTLRWDRPRRLRHWGKAPSGMRLNGDGDVRAPTNGMSTRGVVQAWCGHYPSDKGAGCPHMKPGPSAPVRGRSIGGVEVVEAGVRVLFAGWRGAGAEVKAVAGQHDQAERAGFDGGEESSVADTGSGCGWRWRCTKLQGTILTETSIDGQQSTAESGAVALGGWRPPH
jgi:hypothetical protein